MNFNQSLKLSFLFKDTNFLIAKCYSTELFFSDDTVVRFWCIIEIFVSLCSKVRYSALPVNFWIGSSLNSSVEKKASIKVYRLHFLKLWSFFVAYEPLWQIQTDRHVGIKHCKNLGIIVSKLKEKSSHFLNQHGLLWIEYYFQDGCTSKKWNPETCILNRSNLYLFLQWISSSKIYNLDSPLLQ